MTNIAFKDGKPVLRDGKVGTGSGCCCGNPACCQHFCNKMCCNQVKWVVPGYTDFFTGVSVDCRAGLTVPATGLQIRVRVRCGGYVSQFPVDGPGWAIQYQDCDTDCEIVEVEYSEDNGETWTTTPPASADGITWSIYCSGDEPQPDAQHSPQRCAGITTLNAEQCAAAGGEPCQQECQDCGFACGPVPTEWRVVDHTGRVWFSGDIIENPAFEGEVLCTDSCAGGLNFQHPRLLLQHFPWSVTAGRALCQRGPSGWPVSGEWGINLEVLGCDGANWEKVLQSWCGCYGRDIDLMYYLGGFFPDTTDPCNPPLEQFGSSPPFFIGAAASWFYTTIYQSPAGCGCLRDSAGSYVNWHNSGNTFCCRHCNRYFGVGDCGSGLEYLGHTQGVRFTGEVDQEGSNLWNWQDAYGDSPACWLPTEDGYGGPFVGDRSIVIAGALRSWRSGYGRGYPGPVVFSSVSMEPGAVLAISLTTETLTVDAATIEAIPFGGQLTGYPAGCANAYSPNVTVTVTGTATFINGGENLATGDDGIAEGYAFPVVINDPNDPWDDVIVAAGVTGTCVFETGSKNVGTIRGTCTFSDDASNDGKIAGDCTFADTAANNGSIWGNCTFSGDATNEGAITGDCTFTETAANDGTITGDATFSGNAVNAGTVTGNATFIGNATNTGTVNGNATFANAAYTSDPTAGGVITGTITFSAATPVAFVLSGSSVWSADASAWVFTTSGQNWTFNGSSSNTGTVDGDATFNGSSSNSGTVTGDATFGDTASMAGNVTGTATFTDDACWSSGTAGAFDPDPPPAC